MIVNCSRQAGKSTSASLLALYTALYTANALILLVSPSLRQSLELFRKVRWWMAVLARQGEKPETIKDNETSVEFANGSRVVSLPGTEETIRGYSGATLVIVDEASRVKDDLYKTVRPMLAVSGGRILLMSTPFGQRGFFFDEWQRRKVNWSWVEVNAYQVSRIPQDFLESEQISLGAWWFNQEYMCYFNDSMDAIYTYETIMAAIGDSVAPLFGVDTALIPTPAQLMGDEVSAI